MIAQTTPNQALPKGLRKHIREEKARIRRETVMPEEAEGKVQEMLQELGVREKRAPQAPAQKHAESDAETRRNSARVREGTSEESE